MSADEKCTVTGYVIKSGDKNFIEYDEPVTFSRQMEEACRKCEELIARDEYSSIFGVKNTLYDMVVILTDIGEERKAAQYAEMAASYKYKDPQQEQKQSGKSYSILKSEKDFLGILKGSNHYGAHDPYNDIRFTYASADDPELKR